MSTSSVPSFSDPGAFQGDPTRYRAFDTSGLSNAAIARANEQGANQIAQAKAQAAGMGQGRSSGLNNNIGMIQAGLGANAQNILNQNALQSFQQQLEQMGLANQYALGRAGAMNQGYGLNTQANQAQADIFGKNINNAISLGILASLL